MRQRGGSGWMSDPAWSRWRLMGVVDGISGIPTLLAVVLCSWLVVRLALLETEFTPMLERHLTTFTTLSTSYGGPRLESLWGTRSILTSRWPPLALPQSLRLPS